MEAISNKTCFKEQAKFCKIIFDILKKLGQKPEEIFVAVAGRDYGFVEAYHVYDFEFPYIIKYGDKNGHSYYANNDLEDLDAWLYPHDWADKTIPDFLNCAIKRANLKGIDTAVAANEKDAGPFYVLTTRRYRGYVEKRVTGGYYETYHRHAHTEITDTARDESGSPVRFATIFDAQARILTDGVKALYVTDETYKIISEQSCDLNLG